MRGIAQLGLAVFDPQVHGLGRFAGDHDPVEAGKLQLGRPEAAGLRIADEAAQRALGGGRGAALPGDRSAGRAADEERQRILRPQRIGVRGGVLQQVIQPHRAAAPVLAIECFVGLLDREPAARQIDMQYLSRKTVHVVPSASLVRRIRDLRRVLTVVFPRCYVTSP